jgi:hypothetical protein
MRKYHRFLSLGLAAAVILGMIGIGIPMTASADTIPMTWKEMDKGYVILEMDDASEELETFYKIIVEQYGFPMSSSCWSVDLDTDPEKVARLRWLEDHGGEITSHTHNNLGVYGDTSAADDTPAKGVGALPFIILGACAAVAAAAVAGALIWIKKKNPPKK